MSKRPDPHPHAEIPSEDVQPHSPDLLEAQAVKDNKKGKTGQLEPPFRVPSTVPLPQSRSSMATLRDEQPVNFNIRKSQIDQPKKLGNFAKKFLLRRLVRPKKRKARCEYFPCCCGLHLEVGIQIITVIDLLYCIICTIIWSALLGVDFFASVKDVLDNKTTPYVPPGTSPSTSHMTTHRPKWTFRTSSTFDPNFDYDNIDISILSKDYSKIARMTRGRHDLIESRDYCGEKYFEKFLFTHQLERTKMVWEHFLFTSLMAEAIYVLIALGFIISLCCFSEHKGAKKMIMLLWWAGWIPVYLDVEALIHSQSLRLCIMEYGSERIRGQLTILLFFMFRLLVFKMYQSLVLFFYIKQILVYGFLKDETVRTGQEVDQNQRFFSEFYDVEQRRQHAQTLNAARATETTQRLEFDKMRGSEVLEIQHDIMTGRNDDDPVFKRNREIRDRQAGQIAQNLKTIRRIL